MSDFFARDNNGDWQNILLSEEFETTENKVTTITSSSTNIEYPSAKAAYDYVSNALGM